MDLIGEMNTHVPSWKQLAIEYSKEGTKHDQARAAVLAQCALAMAIAGLAVTIYRHGEGE